jgi:hypothetical protein
MMHLGYDEQKANSLHIQSFLFRHQQFGSIQWIAECVGRKQFAFQLILNHKSLVDTGEIGKQGRLVQMPLLLTPLARMHCVPDAIRLHRQVLV